MQKDRLSAAVFARLDLVPYFRTQYCSLIYPELVVRGPVITDIMRSMTVTAPISRKPAPCHLHHRRQVEQDHNHQGGVPGACVRLARDQHGRLKWSTLLVGVL